MRVHELRTAVELAAPLDEVFAFFSDAGNLEELTPGFLRFRLITPRPIDMRQGTTIEYRLRVHGLPVRWRSEITAWEPPHRFVDEQLRGPYRQWIHEHGFEPTAAGTRVRDHVRWALPLYPFGELALPLVRRDVAGIFAFRHARLVERFSEVEGRSVTPRASP